MKAISIRQPWAWLILRPDLAGQARLDAIARQEIKDIENRTWSTSHRDPVLIHAGKAMTRGEYEDVEHYLSELYETGPYDGWLITLPKFDELERGGIVGMANITDCSRYSSSRWHLPHCFGFALTNTLALPFTPYKGALSLFEVPDHLVHGIAPEQKDCQHGFSDICHAGRRDGVTCPPDSCDIDDGMRHA